MRSRGESGTATLTAESMAERYGVVKGTYTSVPLPRIQAYTVSLSLCHGERPGGHIVRHVRHSTLA